MGLYRRSALENGVRVVTESIPYVRSVAIGFWFRVGSRDESAEKNGISHFIEHLMFKGTKTRTARQIAEIIDASGGQMNAFTSKDHTCYYARVLDRHVGLAVDLLSDMLLESVFAEPEIEKEKGVVLEEIKMYEDSPDELVHDLFAEAAFAAHPLGQGVLGSDATVRRLTRSDVLDYLEQEYHGSHLVVAAAGNLDHDQVVDEVAKRLSGLRAGAPRAAVAPPTGDGRPIIRMKETEQVHLCVGSYALERNHPDRFALHVLDVALGGGMSSRFFQDLREDRGLVYSTYTYHSCFDETGLFSVYAGTSPENAEEVLALIRQGLRLASSEGFHPDELARAKEQLKGSLMIGLENTANRMSRIARTELFGEELLTPDDLIARIDAVTADDVTRIAAQLFEPEPLFAAIGPCEGIAGWQPAQKDEMVRG